MVLTPPPPVAAVPYLASAFGYHQPGVLLVLHALLLIAAWRRGTRTTRALASALIAGAVLHGLAWLMYGSGLLLHAICSAISLAVVLPIVLRSRRFYPLVIGAASLLSALALGISAFIGNALQPAALLFSAFANLALMLAQIAGTWADWRRTRRRRGNLHLGPATDERSSVGKAESIG